MLLANLALSPSKRRKWENLSGHSRKRSSQHGLLGKQKLYSPERPIILGQFGANSNVSPSDERQSSCEK